MRLISGFTLTEVVVSLVLLTGTSIAIMTQQWQASRLTKQMHLATKQLIEADNQHEQSIASLISSDFKCNT